MRPENCPMDNLKIDLAIPGPAVLRTKWNTRVMPSYYLRFLLELTAQKKQSTGALPHRGPLSSSPNKAGPSNRKV